MASRTVSHVITDNEATATHESPVIDEEREFLQLEPTDLVKIICNLKSELARKNLLLKFLGTTTEDIASKRDAFVNIFNFFDSIVASTTALPFLEVRSIAFRISSNRAAQIRLACSKVTLHKRCRRALVKYLVIQQSQTQLHKPQ